MSEETSNAQFRRKVLDIIELLSDSVDHSKLKECLPFLHGNGWDEVVEERYVNKVCGYPTCSRNCRPNNNRQLYHIDRKSGSIFENCAQRNKFCSDHCFEKSVEIRNQLVDESLWITGENSERMNKNYTIPVDSNIKIEDETVENTRQSPYHRKKNVKLVEDKLKAKMSDLRIRDAESDNSSEDEEEKTLKNIEPYEKCSDDEMFVESVQRFVTGLKPQENQQPKLNNVKEKSLTAKQNKEAEILNRLRQKYGGDKNKKGPAIIEVAPLKSKTSKSNETTSENAGNENRLKWIEDLFRNWISDETRILMKEGARGVGGDFENIFLDFMTGKQTELDTSPVDLPTLDKYNIKEKRLNILIQSIRHTWLDLEAHLHLNSTRRHLLSRTVATFELNSENITGWNKKETICIAFTIFLLICQIDVELGDEYFQNGRMSPELQKLSSEFCKIDHEELNYLHSTILSIKNETGC